MSVNETKRTFRLPVGGDSRARLRPRTRQSKGKFQWNEAEGPPTTDELTAALRPFGDEIEDEADELKALAAVIRLLRNSTDEQRRDAQIFGGFLDRIGPRLCADHPNIRAATFRILRSLLVDADRLGAYVERLVDVFAVRSVDLLLLPKEERMEALNLAAQMLLMHVRAGKEVPVPPFSAFPRSIMKAVYACAVQRLVHNAEGGDAEQEFDELNKAALGVLLEVAALQPHFLIETCGTDWIPRVLVQPGVNNLPICSIVCKVLAVWLDDPYIRRKAKLQLVLEQIFSPLLDLGFFHHNNPKAKDLEKTTQTLECCSSIFLNLMRTWPGLFACSSTEMVAGSVVSPLKLLSYLGQVNQSPDTNLAKIRDMVIDVCCEFVCMPYSGRRFASWNEALLFYSNLHLPNGFECSLRDDFVVGEMNSVLQNEFTNTNYVDLLLSFRALATFVLINYGLSQSLARLILMNPNDTMSFKATLLLHDLLRTSVSFMPKNWKHLLLSGPLLIQHLTQSMLNTVARKEEQLDILESDLQLSNDENTIILLQRLEELSTISHTRTSVLSQLKNANLFVLPNKPDFQYAPATRFNDDDAELEARCSEALANALADSNQKWTHVDLVLRAFHKVPGLLNKWQHNDRCHSFFVQITEFFAPRHQNFLRQEITTEIVRAGESAFKLIVQMAPSELYYGEILENYISDFCRELFEDVLQSGIFSTRNILHTNAYLYFGIMSSIGSVPYGYRQLEKAGFFQLCLSLITNASSSGIEYVKLVLSSLNYARPGITRVILETALTATIEPARRWATRFLEVLLSLDAIPDFEQFGMRLLLQQLADPSVKIIRHAVSILNKWLPKYPKARRQLRHVRLETLGEAGVLFDANLQSDEECVRLDVEGARRSLREWMAEFNRQYVHIVEEEMRLALTNFKRSISGEFARASTTQRACHNVRTPFHLLASLASHLMGQQLIQEEGVVARLVAALRAQLTADRCVEVKAALLALGHIVGAVDERSAPELLPEDAVELLCNFAESCPFLSVRGIAFFSVNVAAQSAWGVRQLSRLGWEANRHWGVQEEEASHFHDQQLGEKTAESDEKLDAPSQDGAEVRKSRSHSLYTGAGNEAMTTLRTRPLPSRRRNTSSCLSQPHKPQSKPEGGEEDEEAVDVEWDELGLDLELLKPFMDDSIKPEEILVRKEVNKNEKPNPSASNATSTRLLQRHFVSYVSGVVPFDNFWFLSDTERDELIEYRNVLQRAAGRLRFRIRPKKGLLKVALRRSPPWNAWTVVAMPNEIKLSIFQGVGVKEAETIAVPPIAVDEKPKDEHKREKCPHCLARDQPSALSSFMRSLFDGFEVPKKLAEDYGIRRADVLSTITMLEIREIMYHTRLANHYRDSPVFEHPCMYWDSLELLNELDQSAEVRSFVQQLHWQALAQLGGGQKTRSRSETVEDEEE